MTKTPRRVRAVLFFMAITFAVALPVAVSRPAQRTDETPEKRTSTKDSLLNPKRQEDERAIRALRVEFVKSFDEGNAAALAGAFTEDAELIDELGVAHSGREAIRNRFAAVFEESPGSKLTLEFVSLKFVGDDAAVERGKSSVVDPGPVLGAPSPDTYTAVYVKQNGRWLINELEDHPAPAGVASSSNHDRLKSLEWMVGDWVTEDPESLHAVSIRWDEHKNYLLQDFSVRAGGRVVLSGTQRIGWDAARKSIRSWVFDDEGGFGEGAWSQDSEGRWTVKVAGQTRDGLTLSATRIITILDPHRVSWTSVDRAIGGEAVADIDEFIMVRKPPSPSAGSTKATSGEGK